MPTHSPEITQRLACAAGEGNHVAAFTKTRSDFFLKHSDPKGSGATEGERGGGVEGCLAAARGKGKMDGTGPIPILAAGVKLRY